MRKCGNPRPIRRGAVNEGGSGNLTRFFLLSAPVQLVQQRQHEVITSSEASPLNGLHQNVWTQAFLGRDNWRKMELVELGRSLGGTNHSTRNDVAAPCMNYVQYDNHLAMLIANS